MAAETFVLNQAKGRAVEYYHRVKNNDPANSALIVVPLSLAGTEAQGQDYDTLTALLGDANFDEQTAGGWARKTLTDADLSADAPDDTNNRYPIAVPQLDFGSPTAGNDVQGFAVCYDSDTTSGTDANIIVISCHAVTITADGNQVLVNAGDFLHAS